jgi:hypothetical protein
MRVDPAREGVQDARPLASSEFLAQGLRRFQIADLGQFVVVPLIRDVALIQLMSQPFVSVDIDFSIVVF